MRNEMACHLFARVPDFEPASGTLRDIARVKEIWRDCLGRSGGPFLYGTPTIADFFYFPVLSRFRTYGIVLEEDLEAFARSLQEQPAVAALIDAARNEPGFAQYDDYVIGLGGDPNAAL